MMKVVTMVELGLMMVVLKENLRVKLMVATMGEVLAGQKDK
jgi:hypothetical protein